jgi:hypothetical protein
MEEVSKAIKILEDINNATLHWTTIRRSLAGKLQG